ncbi:DegT/DnrJ/EryC1/StrS family aminotransferase [Leptospira kanakyensis]|uniref:DegT/DnrJ/EryC1/StrS family aminotransferase n=1 Tax=Leptospira kanakyensis TaxID=2484968 RepID=UPI00223E18DA|nr:DegT/DnrJ/EryC1/StrS family aminotransferase [Leptospira kanakyensis]MCW7482119.1 DegT/DnrJ/EryC1/StrS family aminotransferase [Leptospira kanakyensis]
MRLIRLSKSCIGDLEKEAVVSVLSKEFLGMGEETKKFEDNLSEFFGKQVVCVNTGTSALQLALQAIGIGVGDEVLVPSLTYVASFQAISATGAIPIPCDVSLDTCNIYIDDLERRYTSKTKAIMPVHYSGDPCELDSLFEFAKEKKIRIIEDAAHAFGSLYKGKKIGSFGDIACFSFDGIKNITSGEGGCIVSEDKNVIEKVKDLRLLAVQKDSENRYLGKRTWDFDVIEQGWRYHMSNINASLGLVQLSRFAGFSKKRQILGKLYDQNLLGIDQVTTFKRDYDNITPHIYVVRLDKSVDRERLRGKLLSDGIQTGVHYQPNHLLTYYMNQTTLPLPNTELLHSQILTLPLHPDLTEEDIVDVVNSIKKHI